MQKLNNKLATLWLALLTVALGLSSATSAWSAITDGVAAYWNFDNGDFKDSVGLNGVKFDGTANGTAPITFEAGKGGFGQAMRLDGVDQYVEITGGAEDDLAFPGGSISIAGWFTVGTFDKSWQALIAKGEASNWRVHRNGSNPTMAYAGGIGEGPNDGPMVDDGQWHHFVAVSDLDAVNFGIAIYIDGEITSINAGAPNLATNGRRVMIGENPDARGRYWNGLVDDLAIWNRVLTETEVADLYFNGAGKPLSSFYGAHVDTIVTTKGASEPDRVQVQIIDDGTSVFDPNATGNLNVTVDGVAVVPATKSKTGTVSLLNFPKQFYVSASTPQVNVEAKDTNGKWTTNRLAFVIPTYPTIPTDYKLAAPATTPGMVAADIYQIDYARLPSTGENATSSAEQQLARGFPVNGGTPYPNVAAQSSDNTVTVVNWARLNDVTGDYNITATPETGPDNFNSARPTNAPIANVPIPGLPGTGFDQGHTGVEEGSAWNNIVVETTTYLQLTRGAYLMGVNSDDGFKVTTSPGAEDPFGLLVGQFNGARGAANSTFWFVAQEDGFYPFRLLWWQGAGGASVEWFVTDRTTGTKFLVNDAASPIKAFRQGVARAHVKSILPADGFTGANTNTPIKIVLVNGSTTVVAGSISLWIDGSQVAPTIVNGATTTVTYNGAYKYFTSHTGTLVWGESTTPQTMHTNNFTFTIRLQTPDDLPSYTAGSFWIEAEDFDATGTPVPDAVNTMPYDIGAASVGPYDGVGATLNVDYFNNDNIDNPDPAGLLNGVTNTLYRSAGDPNIIGRSVDLAGGGNNEIGSNFQTRRPGGFDTTQNYKIGWGDAADWYNYTRKIPAGLYSAVVALSNGGATIGTPDRMGGTLSIVTSGVGTPNQVLKQVGTFNGPSSGTWSYNNLVPLYAPDGSQAAFKITTATTTLRYWNREGDYDWFALFPVTGIPPKVTSFSPLANTATPASSAVPRDAKVRLTIEDFSTAVTLSTVKLFFDGADVTSSATITKPADVTTIIYTPSLMAGGPHSYEVRFTDNGTPALSQTNKVTFTVSAAIGTPGQFLIEAEDFNFGGGQTVATASTMPYFGGGYATRGAVLDVDYHDSDGNDSRPYRGTLAPNVNHDQQTDAGTLDVARADGWDMTANYKIGWVGTGDWYNYTRTFPANTYEVWAALSHDATDGLRGSLYQVTGDPTKTNQTIVSLGTFNAPTSGAWGTDNLVQMKDSGGNVAVVSLTGVQTVRFNGDSGDYDYLLFVPGAAQIRVNSIAITGGQVTIQWSGGGTIEWTTSLTPPVTWTPTTDSDGSFSENVGAAGNKFYRVKQ